jgi:hypothetical protein
MSVVFDDNWLAGLNTTPIQLDFDLDGFDGPRWVVKPLRHRSGWLLAAEARLPTPFDIARRIIVVGITDDHDPIGPLRAEALLSVRVTNIADPGMLPPSELAEQVEMPWWDFLGTTDIETLQRLEVEERRNEAEVIAERSKFDAMQSKIERMQESFGRERRDAHVSPERRMELSKQLYRLDEMLGELSLTWPSRAAAIRGKITGLQDRAMASLRQHGIVEPLWAIRWRASHGMDAEARLKSFGVSHWSPFAPRELPERESGFVGAAFPAAGHLSDIALERPDGRRSKPSHRFLPRPPSPTPSNRAAPSRIVQHSQQEPVDERLAALQSGVANLKRKKRELEEALLLYRRRIKNMWIIPKEEKKRLLMHTASIFDDTTDETMKAADL